MNALRSFLLRSYTDFGLLVLRLFAGLLMMFPHGLSKLTGFPEKVSTFADPLGLGPGLSLTLVVFAEFFCAAAVVLGFMTRFALIPLIINMAVIAFVVHGDDPWAKKEFALLFGAPYLALLFTGPGRFSLDAMLFNRNRPAMSGEIKRQAV